MSVMAEPIQNAAPALRDHVKVLLSELLPAGWRWYETSETMRKILEAREIFPYKEAKRLFLNALLELAVTRHGNDKTKAAESLDICRGWVPMCQRKIGRPDLDPKFSPAAKQAAIDIAAAVLTPGQTYRRAQHLFEHEIAMVAIDESKNYLKAAAALRVHRNTVWNLVKHPKETQ